MYERFHHPSVYNRSNFFQNEEMHHAHKLRGGFDLIDNVGVRVRGDSSQLLLLELR